MLRRRRPLNAAMILLRTAVAGAALVPFTGMAQMLPPSTGGDVDLLQPRLDGNPASPPRFRKPGVTSSGAAAADQAPDASAFTPFRFGQTPIYGSPTGFGAGDTGFDSSNATRRKRLAQQEPDSGTALAPGGTPTFAPAPGAEPDVPPPKPPLRFTRVPAEIHPARAAARPGAVLPDPSEPLPISNPLPEVHPLSAANRQGAVLPVPVSIDTEASASTPSPGTPLLNTLPLGTPTRPLPIASGDPYEALGIKAGSFLILPAIEFSTAYDTNPQHLPGGAGSVYFVVAPELHVRSDWSSHSLTADITGTYTDYGTNFSPTLNRPYLNSKIDGTIDVTRYTQIVLENRIIVSTDNPGSPNITAGLANLPIDTTIGGTLGVVQTFNRLSVSLKGTFDRSEYQNSTLTDGETASNVDRNFDQYAAILRTSYEIDPGMKPFLELSEDMRIRDLQFDRYGQQLSSNGTSAKLGADVNLFGSLTGEIAVGYLERFYKDPLPNIGGFTADGSLIWQVTGLTTAKLTAASTVSESILPGVSGEFSRDFNIEVDHALRRWLIANAIIGYGRDDYVGLDRTDNRYFASTGITYILNRVMELKAVLRHDWLTSNATGVAYDSTSVLLSLRLQR